MDDPTGSLSVFSPLFEKVSDKNGVERLVQAYLRASPTEKRAMDSLAKLILTPNGVSALCFGISVQESLAAMDARNQQGI
jgi:hypothetical protein